MTEPIDYEPVPDPLYRDPPLPHRATLPVLGIPVRFASNAPAVVAAAEEAFGRWRVLEATPELIGPEGVDVTVVVQPGDEGAGEHAEIYHRALGGERILFGSRGSIALSDPPRREAVGFVTPALVADRQHFRYAIVEAVVLSLLSSHDRQPLHAAALARDGAAVILTGRSGVGKSTLAYAAARAGFQVLAEDTVHLQLRPRLRIWGLPGFLHLPVDARERFPELHELTPTLLANGKRKLAVDLGAMGALPDVPAVDRAALCILSRDDTGGPPGRVAPDAVANILMRDLELGFDRFEDTLRTPLELLAARGAWQLSLPPDPADALPWIEHMLQDVRSAA